jgi:multicomponent Na+:H+ antiporter subunit B
MIDVVDVVLLLFLAATGLAIVTLRSLYAVVMMSGIYSLLSAGFFVVTDAVDVAFTEAAVGAGISTVLMLSTLALSTRREKPGGPPRYLTIAVVVVTGAALIYGTLDMPYYGDPQAPVHQHVAPRYLEESIYEVGMPNVVTSVLASYRGYDTLGETTVIFTAGVGVLLLLGGRRKRKPRADAAEEDE